MDDIVKRQLLHYETNAPTYCESRLRSLAYWKFLECWANRILQPWIDRTTAAERRAQIVLDPMCGLGNLAPFILNHSDNLILNDLSSKMISFIPKATVERCRILEPSDVRKLPLDNDSIDVIAISGGLHHVYRELEVVLKELYRVLKPGGHLLFGEPSNEFLPIRIARDSIYRLSSKFEHETEKALRYEQITTNVLRAGFQSIDVDPYGHIGYLLMGQVGVIPLIKNARNLHLFSVLNGIDRLIEKTPLLKGTCFAMMGHAVK